MRSDAYATMDSSLYIAFETAEDFKKVIQAVNDHNKYGKTNQFIRYSSDDKFQQLTPGPPIELAHVRQLNRSRKSKTPINSPILPYVLVCVDVTDQETSYNYLCWQLGRYFPTKHTVRVYKALGEHRMVQKTTFYEDVQDKLSERVADEAPNGVVYVTRREVVLKNDSKEIKSVFMFDERPST